MEGILCEPTEKFWFSCSLNWLFFEDYSHFVPLEQPTYQTHFLFPFWCVLNLTDLFAIQQYLLISYYILSPVVDVANTEKFKFKISL